MSDAEIVIGIRPDGNGARVIKRDLDDIANSGDKATRSVSSLEKAIARYASVAAFGEAIRRSVSASIAFSRSLSEVSTLLGDSTKEMDKLTAAAKRQAIQFGSTPVEQTKALYQIISAGATSAAQAIGTLEAANKLAIGGVTDVATAADGLTSILNAYGSKVKGATDVSDSLFIAMRAGKTTIAELSSSIGKVAPIAAATGVSFDELSSSIAALTTGGISTTEAVTGVRAILAAIAKPTSEASKLAAQLGIDFTSAGLQAKGFAGFLEDLKKKTGGNTDSLAQLFGGVEALVPVMALTGEAGKEFSNILDDMGNKAGATEEALKKMVNSPGFSVDQALAVINVAAIKVGDTLSKALIPSVKFLVNNFETLEKIVKVVSLAVGTYFVAALTRATAAQALMLAGTLRVQLALGAMAGYSRTASVALLALRGASIGVSTAFALIGGPIGVAVIGTYLAMTKMGNQAAVAQARINDSMSDFQTEADRYYSASDELKNKIRQDALDRIEAYKSELEVLHDLFEAYEQKGFLGKFWQNLKAEVGVGRGVTDIVKEGAAIENAIDGINEQIAEWDKYDKSSGGATLPTGNLPASGKAETAKKLQDEIQKAIEGSRTETERLYDQISKLESLRGFAKTAEQAEGIDIAIQRAREELDQLRIDAELDSPLGKAFSSLASEIEDDFKEAFRDGFNDADGGFKGLIEGWKNTFKTFLADLAYTALARPIVISVVGSLGTAAGLSSDTMSQMLGGNGGGLGGLGDIFSLGKSFFSGGSSFVNSIGSSLGFYNAVPSTAGVYGPVAPSGLFGSTTLSGALAGGGLGMMAANLLGLGSGNMVRDTGLGIAGGAIGAYFGGPVGAGVGSFLGTAVSGIFGSGSKPHTAVGGDISAVDGRGVITKVGSTRASKSTSQKFLNSINDSVNNLLDAVGADLRGTYWASTNLGDVDPMTSVMGQKVSGKSGDINAAVKFIMSRLTTGGDETLMAVMKKSLGMNSNMNNVLSDINFAKSVLGLNEEDIDPLASALDAVNEQFDAMIVRAEALGLPMEKVNETLDEQRDIALKTVKAQAAGFQTLEDMATTFKAFIEGEQLSDLSSLSPERKLEIAQGNFSDLLSKAQGGDLSVTSDLLQSAEKLLTLGKDYYASSVSFAGLESFVNSSIENLGKQLGLPGFATGTSFAPRGLALVGEKGPEIINFNGGESVYTNSQSGNAFAGNARMAAQSNNLLGEMVRQNEENTNEIKNLRREMSRIANRLAVEKK